MNLEQKFIREYEENADGIFRFCYFKLPDREIAKDITQETFMKTWNYLANGGEIKMFKAFFYTTARNLITDFYRKKKSESLDALAEGGFDPVAPSENIEDKIDGGILLDLLRKMDSDSGDLVLMRFVEGLSPKEIASVVGDSPNNVSVKIHRALEKLKLIARNGSSM